MIDVGPNEKSRVAIVVGRVDCNDPPALFLLKIFNFPIDSYLVNCYI